MGSVQPQLPDRVGGRPALDFVNTVDPRHDPDRREYLTDYAAVLAWAGSLDIPLPAPIGALGRLAAMEPDAAAAAHRRAVELRESLYALFAAHGLARATGTRPRTCWPSWISPK